MSTAKKRKRFIIIIITAVLISAFLTALVIISIKKYSDTHTWATIRIAGSTDPASSGSFDYLNEYLKGDSIVVGDVILEITDISIDGTVAFSVRQGDLYNGSGKTIEADTVIKDVKSNYKLDNGAFSLTVTDNRYQ